MSQHGVAVQHRRRGGVLAVACGAAEAVEHLDQIETLREIVQQLRVQAQRAEQQRVVALSALDPAAHLLGGLRAHQPLQR